MRHSQRRRSGRVTPALSEELKVVLTGDLFCSSDPGSCRKRAKTQPQRSAMMPRKRARRGEAPQPEPQPGSALFDVEICESIEVTDSVRSCPAAALSSESDDLCGLELDRLFRLDELDWAFEREAGSPFLEEDGFPDLLDPAREAISAAGDAAPLLGSLADPREPGGGAESGYGRGPSAQPCRDDSSGKSNKNAIAARLNRLRKKEYIRGLETKVSSMATENRDLREENRHLNKRVEELEDETRYLRAVLANESMLAQLLSRLTGVNGMKLSTSLFQEARRNEHDYALPRSGPRPGLRPGGRGAAGGVCLHVDNNHVSVEFCTKCADSASAALTM